MIPSMLQCELVLPARHVSARMACVGALEMAQVYGEE